MLTFQNSIKSPGDQGKKRLMVFRKQPVIPYFGLRMYHELCSSLVNLYIWISLCEKKGITTLPHPLTFQPKYEDAPSKKATWNLSKKDFWQTCNLFNSLTFVDVLQKLKVSRLWPGRFLNTDPLQKTYSVLS